jgi:hypothetical protein
MRPLEVIGPIQKRLEKRGVLFLLQCEVTTKRWVSMTKKNLWNSTKVALGGIFIALSAYVRIGDRSVIKHLHFHFKNLEKEEQGK